MSVDRARANTMVLKVIVVAALALGALAVWGMSQKAAPRPAAPAATPQAAMTEAQAKAEVRRLLVELDSFKNLAGFHDAGFSGKSMLTQPAAWHTDATALRDRISADTSLPAVLRAAPGALLGLGLAYQQSKGRETAGTKGDREMIMEGTK